MIKKCIALLLAVQMFFCVACAAKESGKGNNSESVAPSASEPAADPVPAPGSDQSDPVDPPVDPAPVDPAPADPAPEASAPAADITSDKAYFSGLGSEVSHFEPFMFAVHVRNVSDSQATSLSLTMSSSDPGVLEVAGWQPLGFITTGLFCFDAQAKAWKSGETIITATIPELNVTITRRITVK